MLKGEVAKKGVFEGNHNRKLHEKKKKERSPSQKPRGVCSKEETVSQLTPRGQV